MTILFITMEPLEYRRRVINQINVATALNYKTTVITVKPDSHTELHLPEDCRVERIHMPFSKGIPKFLWFNLMLLFKLLFRRYDIIHARGVWILPAILVLRKLKSFRLVYDANEYFAGLPYFKNRPIKKRFWLTFESLTMHVIDCLVTVSEPIGERFRKRYPDQNCIRIVRNLPATQSTADLTLTAAEKLDYQGNIIMFHGYFMPGRGIEQMVEAMQHIEQAVLLLIGEGVLEDRLRDIISGKKLQNRIYFHPFLPNHRLIPFITQADLGLSLLIPEADNHRYALPNKFFEYIMAGVPILASNIPTQSEYINRYNVGCTVNPEDINALARTADAMLNDTERREVWRANCLKASKELNWETEARNLREVYRQIHRI